jgi:hypothetical protein
VGNTVAAGAAYFAGVFAAGFVLGIIRTLRVAPYTGDTVAVLIELPIILTIAWLACKWAVRVFRVPVSRSHRLTMGAIAFCLLMLAEAVLSATLSGRSLSEHLALYRHAPQQIGLLGQIAFGLFPILQLRR